jgi:hypothetical protein
MAWMPRGVALIPRVGSLVHDARNEIVREALALEGWKTLIMLDSDVYPPPHEECSLDALEIIKEYEEHDLPVVGPLCYGRSMTNPTPVAGSFLNEVGYSRLTEKQHDQMEAKPGLYRMDMLGLGLVSFRRRVFEEMEPPWFHHPVVGSSVLGEDHQFYRRLSQLGVQVFLDTRWHVLHEGRLYFGKRTYQIWREIHETGEYNQSLSARAL